MTIYWLAILLSLADHQQLGHLDAEFANATDCYQAAARAPWSGDAAVYPVCVVMIRTDKETPP